ncbi:MAG: methyltransferase domain-containing protein [Saprospiraceae bacterium]|nr:methyltransferase domain-containing protein [Saprospiraceae bacterium]
MNGSNSCHLCGSSNTNTFFDLPPVPTMDGVMSTTKAEALSVARGKVQLQFCSDCTFIQNIGYDPSKICFDSYDFANDYSPLFSEFVLEISRRLIDTYGIRSKHIVEVASGDGHFLRTICKLGNNTGTGIDPGFDFSDSEEENRTVSFLQEYYSDKHRQIRADLVICRHMINVIGNSKEFLQLLRTNLEDSRDTLVYLEVPNAEYTFGDRIYWNVGYEHGAWFTTSSLKKMMEACHFEVLEVFTCWNDEFIGLIAKPKPGKEVKTLKTIPNGIHKLVSNFSMGFDDLKKSEENLLSSKEFEDLKIVAWGAGARAVTYFNVLNTNSKIEYIVDINVNRQGKYLPGSGTKIVEPDFLLEYKPDIVIITNPTYTDEITKHIRSMGLKSRIMTL